jgi:predicted membrane-bound dolichyl-phosphate-mannose-protein mannosyltransferase
MYNDQIMIMYVLISITLLVKNRPIIASCFLTLALSVKAGAVLLLPSFLGAIQYNFGTRTLLTSLILIAAFQVLVALPFVFGETSVADYLTRSKLTFAGRNGVAFAEEFWDYLAAEKPTSIFWTFLSDEVYYDRD